MFSIGPLFPSQALVAQSCPTLQPHGLYIAHQAPLSMEFSRQEYWSGFPFPSPLGRLRGINCHPASKNPSAQIEGLAALTKPTLT